jgi:hypothetical protein
MDADHKMLQGELEEEVMCNLDLELSRRQQFELGASHAHELAVESELIGV